MFFLLAPLDKPVPPNAPPVFSIHMKDCQIGGLMMNDKDPEEFTIMEKATGMYASCLLLGGVVKQNINSKESLWTRVQNGGVYCGILFLYC